MRQTGFFNRLMLIGLFTVVLLVCCFTITSAQPGQEQIYQAPNILPPSPTASELGKYGLIPVGMSTGTPNVDIPLHVFKTTNLEVPISLSYNSNGVKVDQTASWVGLNFSLNSGGVITRIIRDDPDEDNLINNVNYEYPENFNSSNADALLYLEAAGENDGFDTEPDLFSFNFLGYTGKFIFDRHGNPVIMPYQNLIIQRTLDPETAGLGNFLITTPDGIKYTFGAVETSKSYQSSGCGKNYDGPRESSWYLTEVRHPAGDVISFEYESTNYFYFSGVSQSARGVRQVEVCPGDGSGPSGTTIQTCSTRILAKTVRLLKIESPTFGSVEFSATQDRTDLPDYKLGSISVKSGTDLLKGFSFSYTFSTSHGFSNTHTTEELKHRMFLTSMAETDRQGQTIKIHSFEYEDINGLPPRLSYAQDHWGFFNGASNSHLIPKDAQTKDAFGRYLFENIGGDRAPNSAFSNKGILTRITYPTGGYSQFVYEPNSYWGDKTIYPSKTGFELQAAVLENGPLSVMESENVPIPFSQTIQYTISASQQPGYTPDPIHDKGIILVRDLTLGSAIILNKHIGIEETYSDYLELQVDHEYSFTLTASGEGVRANFSFDYYASVPEVVEDNIETGGLRISKIVNYDPVVNKSEEINYHYARHDLLTQSSGKIGAPPQYYAENLTKTPCSVPCAMSEVTYGVLSSSSQNTLFMPTSNNIYYQYVTVSRGQDFSQGLEEHEFIINFDYAGQQVWGNDLIKDAPLTNFGWNNGFEKYSRVYKKSENGFDLLKQTFSDYVQDSRNYKEVAGLVARKKYNPTCFSEIVVNCDASNVNKVYSQYICITNHHHQWLIGGLTFFGIGGNGETSCIASGANNQWVPYADHPCKAQGKSPGETVTNPTELDYLDAIQYKNIVYWLYLKRKVETTYENGLATLSTETEYVYDNVKHAQLSQELLTGSDGKQNVTVIKYPDDYAEPGNLQTLKDKHIVSLPIKKEMIVNGNQIDGNVVLYNDIGQPKEIYRYETALLKAPAVHDNAQLIPSSDYRLKLEYEYYPVTNTTKEIIPSNAPKKSYLWGYGNTLPIAEVLNASADEVLFVSFEDENGTLESVGNRARTGHKYWNSGSYDFMTHAGFSPGTALKMSYWYWENNKWNFSGVVDFNNALNNGSRLDDIRVFPYGSPMVTYTYDPLIGVTTVTGPSNITSYYEYDAFGRLEIVRDADQNIVNHYKYHYKDEQ